MNFCGLPKGGHDNPLEKAKRPGIFGRLLGKIGASAVYPCVSILVCLPYRVWSSYARRHRSSQRILSTAVDGFLGPASASSTWALEARPAPAESTGDKCDGFPATNVTVFLRVQILPFLGILGHFLPFWMPIFSSFRCSSGSPGDKCNGFLKKSSKKPLAICNQMLYYKNTP